MSDRGGFLRDIKGRWLSVKMHRERDKLLVAELFFQVPLEYPSISTDPGTERPAIKWIRLFARAVTRYSSAMNLDQPNPHQAFIEAFNRPWMVYLEGGPGYGNKLPHDNSLTQPILERGYQILYLDYRGTGLSWPLSRKLLMGLEPQAQAEHLSKFRADNIARDLEMVRKNLMAKAPDHYPRTWSLFGQSFGGFTATTYLSMYPSAVREVFITGGIPPLASTPEQVYRATFQKLSQRNVQYFTKYPEDVAVLARLRIYILSADPDDLLSPGADNPNNPTVQGEIRLPAGGKLTPQRLMTLGHRFGFHGGFDSVHAILVRAAADLDQAGFLCRATLQAIEEATPDFDTAPIYALLHEPCYCSGHGVKPGWAAERVGHELAPFRWLRENFSDITDKGTDQIYFSGEMVFSWMYRDWPELMGLKDAADILAEHSQYDKLYDLEVLAKNKVPVYALAYMDDIYVDFELSQKAARMIGNIKVNATNMLHHNALRVYGQECVNELFRMRDDVVD